MKTESNKILTTHLCSFVTAPHLLLLLHLVITHLLAAQLFRWRVNVKKADVCNPAEADGGSDQHRFDDVNLQQKSDPE